MAVILYKPKHKIPIKVPRISKKHLDMLLKAGYIVIIGEDFELPI